LVFPVIAVRKGKPTQQGLKIPSRRAIRRSVASSTAIETGQSIKVLEQQLKRGPRQAHRVELAASGTK